MSDIIPGIVVLLAAVAALLGYGARQRGSAAEGARGRGPWGGASRSRAS